MFVAALPFPVRDVDVCSRVDTFVYAPVTRRLAKIMNASGKQHPLSSQWRRTPTAKLS